MGWLLLVIGLIMNYKEEVLIVIFISILMYLIFRKLKKNYLQHETEKIKNYVSSIENFENNKILENQEEIINITQLYNYLTNIIKIIGYSNVSYKEKLYSNFVQKISEHIELINNHRNEIEKIKKISIYFLIVVFICIMFFLGNSIHIYDSIFEYKDIYQ